MCQIRDPDKFWAKIRRRFQQRRASKEPLSEQESLSQIRKLRRLPQSVVAATLGGQLDVVVRFPGLLIRIRLGHP